MASFIAPNYVPEFNPYISTIPVDLYAKVITTKQAQYDEGLQRIQSYVQNVTGLEMGREPDKQYYQQKIGQLRSQIESTLSSDMSKRSVVNQAGAFASQLYNDKRIRNSVLSYLHKKDFYNQVSKAQEDGTFAPENADIGMSQIRAWEMGDENAVLGKLNYTPYDNYLDRYTKWMKNVNPDVRLDQYSPLDAEGKPIPYVLKEGKIEAVTDEKVIEAHEAFFQTDASARNQRGLSTRYYSRQMSDDTALTSLQRINSEANRSIDKQIEFYNKQKAFYSNNKERLSEINTNIDKLNRNKETVNKNYQEELTLFRENPNSVKANLYDRQQRNQMVSTFTYKKESEKYVEDPMYQAGFQERKFQSEQEWKQKEYDQKERLAREKAQAEAQSQPQGLPYGATWTNQGDLGLDNDFGSVESVKQSIDTEIQQVVSGQGGLYEMIYEAGKHTDENGRMVSSFANLIEQLPNGSFVKREGVTNQQIANVYGDLKKRYLNQQLDMNDASHATVANWFGSLDESSGEARFQRARRDKSEFDRLANTAGYDSKSYTKTKGTGDALGLSEVVANTTHPALGATIGLVSGMISSVASKEASKMVESEDINRFSKDYASRTRRPGLMISKDKQEGFAEAKADALLQAQTMYPNKIDSYREAINKAEGFFVDKDPRTGEYRMTVASTEGSPVSIPLNPQLGMKYTGGALDRNLTDPVSAIRAEQSQNQGLSQWKLQKPVSPDANDFRIRWNTRYNPTTGLQYPTFEIAYLDGSDIPTWNTLKLPNINSGVSDLQAVSKTAQQLSNYDAVTLLELLKQSNVDVTPIYEKLKEKNARLQ